MGRCRLQRIDELRTALERRRDERDRLKREDTICRWVFHREGERIRIYDKAWRTACTKTGVFGRLVHDFRRTAVRNLVGANLQIPSRPGARNRGNSLI